MLLLIALAGSSANASLPAYDAAIAADAGSGLTPLATLTTPAVLNGANFVAFNFGANSGDVTMEFVLEGNPSASATAAYLAVGANASSNLRYEQFNNTGQLGFTQLGVADYLFSPAVPSPNIPVHVAYVWIQSSLTMKLYLNGSLAGSVSGVSASFAMPAGAGRLGANPTGTEAMAGTIHRVTVYDIVIPDAAIQRHADAYNDVVRASRSSRRSPRRLRRFLHARVLHAGLERCRNFALACFASTAPMSPRCRASNVSLLSVTTDLYVGRDERRRRVRQARVTVVVNPAPVDQ